MIDVDRGPAPPSLASGRYDGDDVIVALHRAFFGKCYLCERPLELGDLEVEHRIPQSERPDLAADWANLYPSCDRCNAQRSKTTPQGGYVSPGEGVETRLAQAATPSANFNTAIVCSFSATAAKDVAAANTAAELQRLHEVENSRGIRKRFKGVDLLKSIAQHYVRELSHLERRVLDARTTGHSAHEAEALLRARLSRRPRFTMLMRSLVDPSLEDLFD